MLEFYKNRNITLSVELLDGNNEPLFDNSGDPGKDIEDNIFYCDVKQKIESRNSDITKSSEVSGEIDILPGTNIIEINFIPSDTVDRQGIYNFDVTMKSIDGKYYTVHKDKFKLLEPVRRKTS